MITGATVQDQSAKIEDLPLFAPPDYLRDRDVAMQQVTARAERTDVLFPGRATDFVVQYLYYHGEASSEEITDACKKAGILPPDDRAFGPIYHALARAGLIVKTGQCARRKGHGTAGGNIWKLSMTTAMCGSAMRRSTTSQPIRRPATMPAASRISMTCITARICRTS